MKFSLGDRVSPVICPEIEMLVDMVQIPERYHCYWFVDREIKDGWFSPFEIQKAQPSGQVGFTQNQME